MLNIDEIQNGIVIDHIKAGTALKRSATKSLS